MKNKIIFIGLIVIIMTLMILFGYTNARYYSATFINDDLGYHPTIGKISIYNPNWVYGYSGENDGSGYFGVQQVMNEFPHIHYSVINKVGDTINEEETQYYIRVVAEDGSDNMPIEYNVHEYDNANNIYDYEDGVGYGPFTLNAYTEQEQKYSLRVKYISYTEGTQYLKVQMIKKRSDNTLKAISEAPLNIQYTGDKVSSHIKYYLYDTEQQIGEQTINMSDNFIIDFTDETQLNELGFIFPEGYIFQCATSSLNNWEASQTITIPQGSGVSYYIEVYLSPITVNMNFNYYDYTDYTEDETTGNRIYNSIINKTNAVINSGTTIDFTDSSQLSSLGIILPENYILQGLGGDFVTNQYYDKTVTIPSKPTGTSYSINIYLNPITDANIKLSYYYNIVDENNLLSTQTLSNVSIGTTIDFTNTDSLTSLGITLPDEWIFLTAYCDSLDSSETGNKEFTISNVGTYEIAVMLYKVTLTVDYYIYGTTTKIANQTLYIQDNFTIDFTNEAQLSELGIVFPEGYAFHDARSKLNDWKVAQTITIPKGSGNTWRIEVYMNK